MDDLNLGRVRVGSIIYKYWQNKERGGLGQCSTIVWEVVQATFNARGVYRVRHLLSPRRVSYSILDPLSVRVSGHVMVTNPVSARSQPQ